MIKYGLDIGSCSLKILGGDFSGEGFKPLGRISIPVKGYSEGTIIDKRKLLYTVLEAVNQFQVKYDKRPSSFVLGISTPQLSYVKFRKKFIRKNADSVITDREVSKYQQELLDEMVPLDRKEIYYEVEEFILDGQRGIINPQGLYASNIEMIVNGITIPLNLYNNILSLFSELGLEIEALVPEAIAQSYIYLSSEEKKSGIMFINYGWGTVKVAIFKNGFLKYYKHLPSNLNSILDLVGEIYHFNGCSTMEILREIFLSETSGFKFQNKFAVQTVSIHDVKTLLNKNIYRLFYQLRKHLEDHEVPLHFKQGIKISGGIITDYSELKSIAEDVFHQPVVITDSQHLGIDSEYVTALGLVKHQIDKEKARFQSKNLLSRLVGKMFELVDKYF